MRARLRFERRERRDMAEDAAKRLGLYRRSIDRLVEGLASLLGERIEDKLVWVGMKAVYTGMIDRFSDPELAETFFNSATRRIFATVGVDADIEFVAADRVAPRAAATEPIHRNYLGGDRLERLLLRVLEDRWFEIPWEDADRDARLVAARIRDRIGNQRIDHAEVADVVFYRGSGAYLVGRLVVGATIVPLALAIRNDTGLAVDAVLLEENDLSILFSYTRAYFHVDVPRPSDLVRFLAGLLPRKRIAELYIAIGFDKHGKTALYRDLLDHLDETDGQFTFVPGVPGLVMVAFAIPSLDLVFKVIRDRFPPPKTTTRHQVMDRYRLVFRHDRAGRLIDAWEFEHLAISRDRFDPALLAELTAMARRSVEIGDDLVVLRHAYLERKVVPLDIYVRTSPADEAAAAVRDYGAAIHDLARSNIFPGDMLAKNFGVTRTGRVVFYDYDELSLLTDITFRQLPDLEPEDVIDGEPWFGVSPTDVFPEEFAAFLGLPDRLRRVFYEQHEDLFDPATWQAIQERIRGGEIIEITPYRRSVRIGVDG